MSYYTVIPNVMDQYGNSWVSNFCLGSWKVLYKGLWLQLTEENTRVRDKNNNTWVEVCEGHMVEANVNVNCACYSKNFNEALNKDLNVFASASASSESVDFVLYGNLIGVADYSPFVYIPYYIQTDVGWQIRLYCINKVTNTIDNITIDSINEPVKANVYVENSFLVIKTETIIYKVGYNYVINANFEPSVVFDYVTNIDNNIVTINDGQISFNGLGSIVKEAQYSSLVYENQICFSAFKDQTVSIYNLSGSLLGTSSSDANSVFFFKNNNLISIEGHTNYIRIRGVES